MGKELTAKEEEYCRQYCIDLNQTQAAIRAGYSEHTASSISSELMTRPRVRARIRELKRERAKRLRIDGDAVLRLIAEMLAVDLSDVAKWRGESIILFDSDKLPKQITQAVQEVGSGEYGPKIKLVDRVRLIELLMRHHGMLTDKVEHNPDGLKIVVDIGSANPKPVN